MLFTFENLPPPILDSLLFHFGRGGPTENPSVFRPWKRNFFIDWWWRCEVLTLIDIYPDDTAILVVVVTQNFKRRMGCSLVINELIVVDTIYINSILLSKEIIKEKANQSSLYHLLSHTLPWLFSFMKIISSPNLSPSIPVWLYRVTCSVISIITHQVWTVFIRANEWETANSTWTLKFILSFSKSGSFCIQTAEKAM